MSALHQISSQNTRGSTGHATSSAVDPSRSRSDEDDSRSTPTAIHGSHPDTGASPRPPAADSFSFQP